MKKRSLALVVALVMVISMSASVFASANPFADVPADHWAYDAIVKLAAVGLVEGYPDGTYGGARMLTRYEAAMVFARTLARMEALVEEGTYGMRDQITAEVMEDLERVKAELTQLIKDELAAIEIPVVEKTIVEQPIEKVVERQPIEVERPFQMTPEAEAAISQLVAELTQEKLAAMEDLAKETIIETQVIERVVTEEVDEAMIQAMVEEVLAYSLQVVEERLSDVENELAYLKNERAMDRQTYNVRFGMLESQVRELESKLTSRLEALEAGHDELAAGQAAMEERQDILESDISFLRSRTLGLTDALRGDINRLEEAMEEEIAWLAAAMDEMMAEFDRELAMLGLRVDNLETVYVELEERVTDLALEFEDFKADEFAPLKEEVERVRLSGELDTSVTKTGVQSSTSPTEIDNGGASGATDDDTTWSSFDGTAETILGDEYENEFSLSQNVNLELHVKASDDVDVRAFFDGQYKLLDGEIDLKEAGVEVTSTTPISRVLVGTLSGVDDRFSGRVHNAAKDYGALMDIDIMGADLYLVASRGIDGDVYDVVGAAAKYEVIPELGVKAAYTALSKDADDPGFAFDATAMELGAFGEFMDVEYDLFYGIDNYDLDPGDDGLENNTIIGAGVDFEFAPVTLSAKWARGGANYGEGDLVSHGFIAGLVDDDRTFRTRLELGAGVEILNMDINAGYYTESQGGAEGVETVKPITAFKLDAEQAFDFMVPITLSGAIANMNDGDEATENLSHMELKLAVDGYEIGETGLEAGASFAIVQGYLSGDWKDPGNWTEKNLNILTADLGYGMPVGSADLDLGYAFKLAMPSGETSDEWTNEITHSVTADYHFTSDLGLNLSAKHVAWGRIVGNETTDYRVNQIKAGLNFKF